MTQQQLILCDKMGLMFKNSVKMRIDSKKFVKYFMSSSIAASIGSDEAYFKSLSKDSITDMFLAEAFFNKPPKGITLDSQMMYWTGYLYAFWHFYTSETFTMIYRQIPIDIICDVYEACYSLPTESVVRKLKTMVH